LWRPEVDITVSGPYGRELTVALLDTGSDQTVLPLSTADKLGVPIQRERRVNASGVRGDITTIVPGTVQIEINGFSSSLKWTATVGFANFPGPDEECALLGYGGCLEFFTVIFDGGNRIVELHPNRSFPRRK
jgi:hypothetical protein